MAANSTPPLLPASRGVDEVQSLDFATGIDLARWYFEASPGVFHKKACSTQRSGASERLRLERQRAAFSLRERGLGGGKAVGEVNKERRFLNG